jgi:hypothetical protein
MTDIIKHLEEHYTDFTIHNRDWWRPNIVGLCKLKVLIRYEVHIMYFFCRGSGIGRTLEEAVQRAERNIIIKQSKIRYASDDDINQLIQDI